MEVEILLWNSQVRLMLSELLLLKPVEIVLALFNSERFEVSFFFATLKPASLTDVYLIKLVTKRCSHVSSS